MPIGAGWSLTSACYFTSVDVVVAGHRSHENGPRYTVYSCYYVPVLTTEPDRLGSNRQKSIEDKTST